MTFAINCGLVSCFLQELWKSLLFPVEGIPVIHEAVFVAVFTRLNHRSTWTANGIGAEAVLEMLKNLDLELERKNLASYIKETVTRCSQNHILTT